MALKSCQKKTIADNKNCLLKKELFLSGTDNILLFSEEDEELDLTGIDDDEIDSYIMSPQEIKLKTKLWLKVRLYFFSHRELRELLNMKINVSKNSACLSFYYKP